VELRYVLGTVLLTGCSTAGTTTTSPAARADSTLEIVVANQQSASASILMADGSMKHVTVGMGPHEAAISRDGKWAIVTVYGAQQPGNQLAVIDLERDSVVRTISLGQYTRPHGGLFIGNSNSLVAITSETTRNLVIVNIATGTVETAIPTEAAGSHMVAITRDGTRAYTGNIGGASVSEIDLTTRNSRARSADCRRNPKALV
jgi:DNA-binding beta-propeller fold protein YncE